MVGEHRSRRKGDSDRHCQDQQRTASAGASSDHQDRSILARDSNSRLGLESEKEAKTTTADSAPEIDASPEEPET